MAERIYGLARDLLPPILARFVRRIIRGDETKRTERFLPELGRTIKHRPTKADRGVIDQIFASRDYDLARLKRAAEIQQFYEGCRRPLIVDVGANIGTSAVWFGCQYPRTKIVAVEPEAGNFSLLEKNISDLDVRPVHGAIANKTCSLELFDPGEGDWGYRTQGGGAAIASVRAFTLRELVDLEPDTTPFILKMDIEGAESSLFEDDPQAYSRFPVVIVEIHDWMLPRQGSSKSFLRWHTAEDRDLVIRGENLFSLSNELLPQAL